MADLKVNVLVPDVTECDEPVDTKSLSEQPMTSLGTMTVSTDLTVDMSTEMKFPTDKQPKCGDNRLLFVLVNSSNIILDTKSAMVKIVCKRDVDKGDVELIVEGKYNDGIRS